MNLTQALTFGVIGLLLAAWVWMAVWTPHKDSIKSFRWNYRNASASDIAKAPLIALIATTFLAIPLYFKEVGRLFWGFLRQDFGVIVCSFLLVATSPVSFPVIAWVSRKQARKEVIRWKKRNLKERAGGAAYDV
ncbi:hypothetical protein V8U11_10950 [Pseudomonas chlororaphis]|uniref:hypothetical protein n=1 Tax=Pseudomonas chlororaphis TaxID=587753 RepID=UPI0030D2F103